ncbi:MAG TPA: VOC family protein [Gaiellaceae bacterium]|nr:VOC family protein [Gaiellaceae bacterium]
MLGSSAVIATIAVKDIDAAAKFYEGTLGLTKADIPSPDPSAIMYRSGDSAILVYQSSYAGTNQATYASWAVGDDIESVIDDLRSKGVGFEQYDNLPGVTRDGDVHLIDGLKSAWFKDPDGNILNLVNQTM